jgi:hypothetical protein
MLVPDITSQNKSSNKISSFVSLSDYATYYNMSIFFDDKEKVKFIKDIEKIVRNSYEYKNLISIFKNELNYTRCTFYPSIDISQMKNVYIEFHHYPFTLFDIVSIELKKVMDKGIKQIEPYDIADIVLQNHYKFIVGLVPLSVTVHQLTHDGQKFINEDYVLGDYSKYIERYAQYIDDEYYTKLDEIHSLSIQENNGELDDTEILRVKLFTLNNDKYTVEDLIYLVDKDEKVKIA